MTVALWFAVLGAALVVLALWGFAAGYPQAPLAPSRLSAKEQAVLAACADALVPRGGSLPLSATDAGVVAYFDRMLGELPLETRALIKLLLHFLEHGPWVFDRRARLTRQTEAEREATMRAWSTSDVYFQRIALISMRTLLAMAYLADPRVVAALGAEANLSPFEPGASA